MLRLLLPEIVSEDKLSPSSDSQSPTPGLLVCTEHDGTILTDKEQRQKWVTSTLKPVALGRQGSLTLAGSPFR